MIIIIVLVKTAIIAGVILEIIQDIKNRVDSDQTDNPKDDKEQ